MAKPRHCPECGTELPADAPERLCPRCLLSAGPDDSTVVEGPAGEMLTIRTDDGDPTNLADTPTLAPTDSEPPAARSPAIGETVRCFGDYELLEEIARGGMGVVYRARQRGLNRIVALKMILSGQLASRADVERFQREAEAAANLDHPGIVPVFEVGERDGQHYFSMAFVDGKSLSDLLAEGPFAPDDAADICAVIAEAMAFAHDHGVIHRDLKPANILVDGNGLPRIVDFGLARRIDRDGELTTTGQILGTPSYMSPEQAAGRVHDVTLSADIYSVGAILHALLTGVPPFQAETHLDTLIQVVEQEPVPPRDRDRDIPRDLQTICLKCLSKNPDDRYVSMAELAEDFRRFLDGEPIRASVPNLPQQLSRWFRSRPALAATLTALAVFYLIHLVCLWILRLPGEGGVFHWTVTVLVAIWAVGAIWFQQLLLRDGTRSWPLYAWSALDLVLFTTVLQTANGPSSPMVIGYLLLVAAAGLRFRLALVWFVFGLSVAGYLTLLLDAAVFRPEIRNEVQTQLYFLMALFVTAGIMHLMLRRVRVIAVHHSESSRALTGGPADIKREIPTTSG